MLAKRVYLAVGVLLVLVFGGVGIWRWRAAHKKPEVAYKTAAIEKRNITAKVTASGTLSATITVQVGAQVSGRIAKLNADFNTPVKKGELIAELDPALYEAAVAQAQANYDQALAGLSKSKASADLAKKQLVRTNALHEQSLSSQQDLDTAASAVDTANADVQLQNANVEQARAQLNQARVNLSYTKIFSPIDGVVISRSVDVGQTVAASLQAPVLFTIAEDLRKMQVDTNVSEGDVGRLKEGMKAFFTVDAFPGKRFHGTIAQIRNAATNVQNVVTYDAVIKVDNDELELRPGMTANVTIVYAQRKEVDAVPNAALRFHPPDWQAEGGHHKKHGEEEARTVFVVEGVAAKPTKVETGLTDGLYTELTGGDAHEGEAVAVDTVDGNAPKAASPMGGGGHGRMF
ncbi:MAG TPA: efflux RND transporter periplasmic adaptor subunit [Polyangiaceae bacterium]